MTSGTSKSYIDAHCHLNDLKSKPHLEIWLEECERLGITQFILGGVGPEDWSLQKELIKNHPEKFFAVFGLHPWWVASHTEAQCEEALSQLAGEFRSQSGLRDDSGPVGFGEVGLDFGKRLLTQNPGTEAHQMDQMRKSLGLASKVGKPLVLHVVRAHTQALQILKESGFSGGGIVHSFNGDLSQAKAYRSLGFHLSLGTSFVRSKDFGTLKQAVVGMPIDSWVLETDSPDQPLPPEEGTATASATRTTNANGALLNPPTALFQVARTFAELFKISADEALSGSRDRLREVFQIPCRPSTSKV